MALDRTGSTSSSEPTKNRYYPIIDEADLPVPRLELRWREWDGNEVKCDYNLVFQLGPYDIRHKRKDEYTGKSAEKKIRLGSTKCTSGRDPSALGYKDQDGRDAINTPFRDGAHIQWDGDQLKLRAFVVAHGKAQELATCPKSMPTNQETVSIHVADLNPT